MRLAAVRAALRIARRDAWRAKGRSALVVAMIGLPMLGIAFADVAARTGELPPAERARRELGGADLLAEQVSSEPIEQMGLWSYSAKDQGGPGADGEPDLRAALPAGSRVTARRTYYQVRFGNGDRAVAGQLEQVDLADPMARGVVRTRSGALPRAAGEAAVTPAVAAALRIGTGDTVSVTGAGTFRVTGVVAVPSSLSARQVFVPAVADLPDALGLDVGIGVGRRWAVTLPGGTRDTDLVPALNALGMRVLPRTWFFDPPEDPYDNAPITANDAGVGLVVVGLATLEIVLLAGTAFAVGARRQSRTLALVAATGGDRRDVRRVVLAGGVVLGGVAGALGVVGGIVAVVLSRPLLERISGSLLGPLDVRPLEMAAIVAVGTGTAVLAALLPARAASRRPVVAALTGRRGDAPVRRRVPALALLAVAAGAALAFWAAGDGGFDPVTRQPNGRPANFPLVLAGAALAELGFVACAPGLVALVGRLASRLPLSLRLAARDAARHRGRSGPAVAAVVAAVAGSVALSVYIESDTARQRAEYQPRMPAGAVLIGRYDASGPDEAHVTAAVAELPVKARVDIGDIATLCRAGDPCGGWTMERPARFACDRDATVECYERGPRAGNIAVGEPAIAEWALGRPDERVAAALRSGAAVVFDARWLVGGKVVLKEELYEQDSQVPVSTRRVELPAVVADAPVFTAVPGLLLTPATAREHDLPTRLSATVALTSRMPTRGEEAAALGALTRNTAVYGDLYVERGFRPENAFVLLVLVAGSAVITLGATGIATGLAAADSRADLATLASVGAAPGIRRRLVMAQAATVAALGSALGILAGLVPSVAVVSARADFPLDLPWTTFGLTVAGAPALAALVVGLFTRARLPMQRRIA